VVTARLWLLRHAAVAAPPGLCYGSSDLAAHADATRDAGDAFAASWSASRPRHAAAPATRSQVAQAHGVTLHSSPLRRCIALARDVEERLPALGPVHVDPRLAEMDFGDWEGLAWDAIGRERMDDWLADFADAPAGASGESTRRFMARVGAAWDAWRASRRDAVWVTHAGVMRAAMLLHEGVRCPADAAAWPARPIAFGEWLVFERPADADADAGAGLGELAAPPQAGGGVLGR
jgi:alpha-ribazole phosphatase